MSDSGVGVLHNRINRLQTRVDELETMLVATNTLLVQLGYVTVEQVERYVKLEKVMKKHD